MRICQCHWKCHGVFGKKKFTDLHFLWKEMLAESREQGYQLLPILLIVLYKVQKPQIPQMFAWRKEGKEVSRWVKKGWEWEAGEIAIKRTYSCRGPRLYSHHSHVPQFPSTSGNPMSSGNCLHVLIPTHRQHIHTHKDKNVVSCCMIYLKDLLIYCVYRVLHVCRPKMAPD